MIGPADPRPAAQPGARPRRRDRLADHHARPRADLVDRADPAVAARRGALDGGQARLDRLSDRRHPAARRRDPARRRLGHAPARVLPARLEHRGPARHRLRLRPGHARRRLRRPGLARRRLDQLLPAVGRGGAAPVDGRSRAGRSRPRRAPHAAAAGDAHLRVADRAGHGPAAGHRRGRRPLRGQRRRDHPVRPRRDPHGRPRAPAGALRRARTDPQRRRRRSRRRHQPRGHLPTPRSPPRARSPATRWPLASAWPRSDRVVVADAELAAAWPVTPATAAALLERRRARHAAAPVGERARGAPRPAERRRPRSCWRSRSAARRTGCSRSPARSRSLARCRAAWPRWRPRCRSRSRARP